MAASVVRLQRDVKEIIQKFGYNSECPPIFVTLAEHTVDHCYALVVGPPGTPYDGGLFAFELQCSPTYPNTPPAVRILSTAYGAVRFNPNLYSNGKVCLSILGTWAGDKSGTEAWRSSYSLGYVLQCIQCLILNEEPFFNEPGFDKEALSLLGTRKGPRHGFGFATHPLPAAKLPQPALGSGKQPMHQQHQPPAAAGSTPPPPPAGMALTASTETMPTPAGSTVHMEHQNQKQLQAPAGTTSGGDVAAVAMPTDAAAQDDGDQALDDDLRSSFAPSPDGAISPGSPNLVDPPPAPPGGTPLNEVAPTPPIASTPEPGRDPPGPTSPTNAGPRPPAAPNAPKPISAASTPSKPSVPMPSKPSVPMPQPVAPVLMHGDDEDDDESVLSGEASGLSLTSNEKPAGYRSAWSERTVAQVTQSVKAASEAYALKVQHETIRVTVCDTLESAFGMVTPPQPNTAPSTVPVGAQQLHNGGKAFLSEIKRLFRMRYQHYVDTVTNPPGRPHHQALAAGFGPAARLATVQSQPLDARAIAGAPYQDGDLFERMPYEGETNQCRGTFQYAWLLLRLRTIKERLQQETQHWAEDGAAATAAQTRVAADMVEAAENLESDGTASGGPADVQRNAFDWRVTLMPTEGPYADSVYTVSIVFHPEGSEPPRATFDQPIWHPNVSADGVPCDALWEGSSRANSSLRWPPQRVIDSLAGLLVKKPSTCPGALLNREAAADAFSPSDDKQKAFKRKARQLARRTVEG